MQVIDVEQGTPEWFEARLGKVTASRIADIIAKTKTGYSASRANYAAQLVVERLTGKVPESFTNAAMQWGTETEPVARAAYKFERAEEVIQVGFVIHPTIGDSGASPDGLVGEDGILEIKCPETKTHIDTLLGKAVPSKYIAQIQWQMACTGRKWTDFVSFDPRMPESMQLFCCRVERDDKFINELESEVVDFLKEVRERVESLKRSYSPNARDDGTDLLMAG